MEIAYTAGGFLVGVIVGLTGVGGGALMTPLLILGFGLQPAVAVGTDLLFAALTKVTGVVVHHRRATVQWRIVGLLAAGSLPGALLALALLSRLQGGGHDLGRLVTGSLAAMLILTSLVLFTKEHWQRRMERVPPAIRRRARRLRGALTVAAGLFLGVMVTLSSIGAGALGAAIIFLLYPRLRTVAVVGSDLAHAVPLALIAGLGHLRLGTVDFDLLGALLLGSLPGIWLGSHLGLRAPERWVRPALAGMLLFIGLRFAF